jgi:magnesium transporter
LAATVTVRWMDGADLREGALDDLAKTRKAGSTVWIDVLAPDEASLEVLRKAFGLHPVAIEDALHFPQRPKLESYDEAAFLVWQFPRHGDHRAVAMIELDVFLGDHFLITSHRDDLPVIAEVCGEAAKAMSKGADWTLHVLLDRGVDDLFPMIDKLSERLDHVEDAMLGDPAESDLHDLYGIKRALMTLYRVVGMERDVLRGMARRQEFVSQDAYLYFQDVGDHLARAVDTLDTYRDVASGTMDLYLSAVSNRLNVVMKRLTLVATIFMPLSFITGIYGMNLVLGMWPSSEARWAFPTVMLAMLVITAGMLWYSRRRRWW